MRARAHPSDVDLVLYQQVMSCSPPSLPASFPSLCSSLASLPPSPMEESVLRMDGGYESDRRGINEREREREGEREREREGEREREREGKRERDRRRRENDDRAGSLGAITSELAQL